MMEKNYYLTGSEQIVYNLIRHGEMITSAEIRNLFPELSTGMLYKILFSLNQKGYLYRIKRDLYLVQQKPGANPIIENPYRIALALYKGYIGFSSALRLYELIQYEPFTLFVVTPKKSDLLHIGDYIIKAVAMGRRATGMTVYKEVYVSNIEKTFFDCFFKPQYCGGYETITRALYEKKAINWDRFLKYFVMFASPSLCQRTGYVLDMMVREIDFAIPENVIGFFKDRIRNKTRLSPTSPSRGKFSGKWKVLDNLGEKILRWHHGS
ncbi:MAG: hypothetical protein K9W43_04785 [Candidatus Thorarchaeota archaeon]|nr:hypothetical protein [Candidatus Thorarchaeota archaeon]